VATTKKNSQNDRLYAREANRNGHVATDAFAHEQRLAIRS